MNVLEEMSLDAIGVDMRKSGPSWTKQQEAIFEEVVKGKTHLQVEALAGSGKTSTMIEATRRLREPDTMFVAFNKSIARELQEKLGRSGTAKTLHSYGLQTIIGNVGQFDIDSNGDKVKRVLARHFTRDANLEEIARVVSLCKAELVDGKQPLDVERIIDEFDLELYPWITERVASEMEGILAELSEDVTLLDFDDMVWLPPYMGWRPRASKVTVVDEAQDLNRAQQELVMMGVRDGRVIVVGDSKQSLYRFRGADSDSMARMYDRLAETPRGVTRLPLTVSFRCPKRVVAIAQRIVPEYQPAPWAKDGIVRRTLVGLAEVEPGDAIVCRTNAPLIEACMELVAEGKRARVQGRDFATGLMKLVARIRKMMPVDKENLDVFLATLAQFEAEQIQALHAANKPHKAAALHDRCECIRAFRRRAKSVTQLTLAIERIFGDERRDNRNTIVLSSVHRFKGDERDRVFVLAPDLMPHPKAQDKEMRQEFNILYVAVTRAKKELVFMGDYPPGLRMPVDDWPKEEDIAKARAYYERYDMQQEEM